MKAKTETGRPRAAHRTHPRPAAPCPAPAPRAQDAPPAQRAAQAALLPQRFSPGALPARPEETRPPPSGQSPAFSRGRSTGRSRGEPKPARRARARAEAGLSGRAPRAGGVGAAGLSPSAGHLAECRLRRRVSRAGGPRSCWALHSGNSSGSGHYPRTSATLTTGQ